MTGVIPNEEPQSDFQSNPLSQSDSVTGVTSNEETQSDFHFAQEDGDTCKTGTEEMSHPPFAPSESSTLPGNVSESTEDISQTTASNNDRVKTKKELKDDYLQWEIKKPEVELRKRAEQHWNTKYNPQWKSSYPWLEEVHQGVTVIGVVCRICRTEYNKCPGLLGTYSYKKTGGLWINRPVNKPWGTLLERCKQHEFGINKYNKNIKDIESNKPLLHHKQPGESLDSFRKRLMSDDFPYRLTEHLQRHKNQLTANQNDEMGGIVPIFQNLNRPDPSRLDLNLRALKLIISFLLTYIRRNSSPYLCLEEDLELESQRHQDDLMNYIQTQMKYHYKAPAQINEFNYAIYLTTHLGVYLEICANLEDGEEIFFGLSIDAGSRFSKAKEWAGVAIRFVKNPNVIERVIGFKPIKRKTGLHLIKVLQDVVDSFNDKTALLVKLLGNLFPLKFKKLPILKLSNCTNLGLDGAMISKDIHINNRIRKFNPRCLSHHCAPHRANLVIEHVSLTGKDTDAWLSWGLDIHIKLHDLVKSSARVRGLFTEVQQTLKETQYIYEFPARPMFRWESERNSLRIVMKLFETIKQFLEEIQRLRWDSDFSRKHLRAVPFLLRQAISCKFLLYCALKLDLLDILVPFTKFMEKTDVDVCEYLDAVKNVKAKLKLIVVRNGGENYRQMVKNLDDPNFKLRNWPGVYEFSEHQSVEDSYTKMLETSTWKMVDSFDDLFSQDSLSYVQMFSFFSMNQFRREVCTISQAEDYCIKYRDPLVSFFCNPVEFTAKWKEPASEYNQVFTADPLCSPEELKEQLSTYCLYVYQNFMYENIRTRKPYTTKDVIQTMINENHSCFHKGTPLYIVINHFLTQMLSSASVERLFSSHTYLDTAYKQALNDQNTEIRILSYKEMPQPTKFDMDTTALIWSKMEIRKTHIPKITSIPSFRKELIKPFSEIEKARELKEKAKEKSQQKMQRNKGSSKNTVDFDLMDFEDPHIQQRYHPDRESSDEDESEENIESALEIDNSDEEQHAEERSPSSSDSESVIRDPQHSRRIESGSESLTDTDLPPLPSEFLHNRTQSDEESDLPSESDREASESEGEEEPPPLRTRSQQSEKSDTTNQEQPNHEDSDDQSFFTAQHRDFLNRVKSHLKLSKSQMGKK